MSVSPAERGSAQVTSCELIFTKSFQPAGMGSQIVIVIVITASPCQAESLRRGQQLIGHVVKHSFFDLILASGW